jgi:hypothetical protein
LASIQKGNPVWSGLRYFASALLMIAADLRYPLFWVGLESLFGPDDGNEITYKLAQRIAFFISKDRTSAREAFRKVKACYGMRSKILHGRLKDHSKMDELMQQTEEIVRASFTRVIDDLDMMPIFLAKDRDGLLEDWVFDCASAPLVE